MATCASCGTNNVEGTKFCVSCGATLAPAPGSWRVGTDELHGQPSTGSGASSAPNAAPPGSSSNYAPDFSMPPTYAAPQAGSMYAQPAGVPGVYGQMRYAEWIDRVFAALIDGALTFAVMIVLFFIFGALAAATAGVGGDDNPLPGGIFCMGMLVTSVSVFGLGIFNKIYLVSKRGSSIGQGVMKLKVVDATGNIPPLGTLIIRLLVQVGMSFVPILAFFLILADVLWPLWDEQKQTLHDKAAGTFVIKTT
ncbi:MAG TPA: RDD family protein [Pyrinomonadaceae bacterium]|nr:RDD family protein [Pyrinomonadaceae bacterium]